MEQFNLYYSLPSDSGIERSLTSCILFQKPKKAVKISININRSFKKGFL